MKKTSTKLCMLLFVMGSVQLLFAQMPNTNTSIDRSQTSNKVSVSPALQNQNARTGNPSNETQAIFDVQFNYLLPTTIGASCVYTGTEFWVGTYGADSLYTFDASGNLTSGFTVPGVGTSTSGVRGLTYDGTYLYAVCNTAEIFQIDPATKSLIGTITIPTASRGIAYDSTADGGLGGFWICNFGSAFDLVNMSGSVLESITAVEHGCISVYGIAFDPYTAGGPYLWAYAQGTGGNEAKLNRVSIPTHSNTGIIHNTALDVAGAGALAGSVSVTWRYDPSHLTLMGVSQSSPVDHLFGYELADYIPPSVDVSCDGIDFYPPYSMIPGFALSPMNWDVHLTNLGIDPLADVATTFVIDDGTSPVYSPVDFHSTIAPNSSAVANFGSYTPPTAPQVYNVSANANPIGQTDQFTSNNDFSYSFAVTDTIMARDDNNATSSLGLPAGFPGVLGQIFEIPTACDVTSATVFLRNPDIDDSVSIDLYTYSSQPDAIIASTGIYQITAADTTNGVLLTLPFLNGPNSVTAGTYFLGVNQYSTDSNISIGTTPFNFRPNSAYFMFTGGNWTAVENNTSPFLICYLLRLNMNNWDISVGEIAERKFRVYPNPATSQINIQSIDASGEYSVELYDMIGNKVAEKNSVLTKEVSLDVSGFAPGLYTLRTIANGSSASMKVAVN
jgi:hypothetical protein